MDLQDIKISDLFDPSRPSSESENVHTPRGAAADLGGIRSQSHDPPPDVPTDDHIFECKICGRSFHDPNNFRRHVRCVHPGTTYEEAGFVNLRFSCPFPECDKTFSAKCHLNYHYRVKHDPEYAEAHLKCDICQKCFRSKRNLESHLNRHQGVKPFECGICGLAFFDLGQCNRHVKVHLDSQDKVCVFCRKVIVGSFNCLEDHYRIHTKESPFNCDKCDSNFTNVYNLRKHKKFNCRARKSTGRKKSSKVTSISTSSGGSSKRKKTKINFNREMKIRIIKTNRQSQSIDENTEPMLDGVPEWVHHLLTF